MNLSKRDSKIFNNFNLSNIHEERNSLIHWTTSILAIDTGLEDLIVNKGSMTARVEVAVRQLETHRLHVGLLDGLQEQRMALEIYKDALQKFMVIFKELMVKVDREGERAKDQEASDGSRVKCRELYLEMKRQS